MIHFIYQQFLVYPPSILILLSILFLITFNYVIKNFTSIDKSAFVFSNVFVCIIKTATFIELKNHIVGLNNWDFISVYIGLHFIRNILSYNELKLNDLMNSSAPLSQSFSVKNFIVVFSIYSFLLCVYIYRVFELVDNSVTFILLTEFICIPFANANLLYVLIYVIKRLKDSQWTKNYTTFLFNSTLFDLSQFIMLLIHYIYLAYFTSHTSLIRCIWSVLNVGRICFGAYKKIEDLKNYFIALYMNESIRIIDLKEGECPVCFKQLNKNCTKFPCGHTFHYNCIKQWLANHILCPTCKENILVDEIDVESHIRQLPTVYRFLVRLHQFMKPLFGKRCQIETNKNIKEEIKTISEIYPMIPSYNILLLLNEHRSVNEVIEFISNNEEYLQQFVNNDEDNHQNVEENNNVEDEQNNETLHQRNYLRMDEFEEGNKEESDEDDGEDEDEDVDLSELMRINEERKQQMLKQYLE